MFVNHLTHKEPMFFSGKENHVHAIYKLSRPGEDTTIRSLNMDNHKLLWHGSSMSNFISILHRGLLVAPPEIPMTGALFGEVSNGILLIQKLMPAFIFVILSFYTKMRC